MSMCTVHDMRSRRQRVLIKLLCTICFVSYLVYVFFVKDLSSHKIKNDLPKPSKTSTKQPLKYILLWTPTDCVNCVPFHAFGNGRISFKRLNCPYTNCHITPNRTLLGDYTKFDAILFNGRQVIDMTAEDLPTIRSQKQIYVFVQLESADRFPVCSGIFDDFFNRTFTYRLDSDFIWSYLRVVLLNGTVVGPSSTMKWIASKDMKKIDEDLSNKLKFKKKAAAWFVSNCRTRSRREDFAKFLRKELQRYLINICSLLLSLHSY